ncbi:MAG: hypothetical protein CMP47_07690 [Rickettsiales bacterium]|nr:hypothetical protein [Rickettsiales bacterium]
MLKGNNSRIVLLVISAILLPIILANICGYLVTLLFEELITYSHYQQQGCEQNPRLECLQLLLNDLESRELYTLALSSLLVLATQTPLSFYLFRKRSYSHIKFVFLASGFASLPYLAEYFANQNFQTIYFIWLANTLAISIGLYFAKQTVLE